MIATLIASLAAISALICGSRVVGGADSYGYFTEAQLMLSGTIARDAPFDNAAPWPDAAATFAPLGYHVSPDGAHTVPTYSPGYPLLMAAAGLIGGTRAMFAVVPISAGLLVFAVWLIGCRITSTSVALGGALITAASPIVLMMAAQPMSDVPAAAAWALAIAGAMSWSIASALLGGFAAAIAIIVRPNLAVLAAVIALWIVMARDGNRVARWSRAVLFACVASVGAVAIFAWNARLYGNGLQSGYGNLEFLFDRNWLWGNIVRYTNWLSDSESVIATAAVALLCCPPLWRRILPTETHSAWKGLAAFAAVVGLSYAFYLQFEDWTYLRFLLPAWPAVTLATAALTLRWHSKWPEMSRLALFLLVALLVEYAAAVGAFRTARDQQEVADTDAAARSVVESNAVILSMQHSGSLRLAGLLTLRYDLLDPAWLDRTVVWLKEHQRPAYVLLEGWEVERFKQRFGDDALGRQIFKRERNQQAALFEVGQHASAR